MRAGDCPVTSRMIGRRYGQLTVLRLGGKRGAHRCVVVRCSCGSVFETAAYVVRQGLSRRCRACHDECCARTSRANCSVRVAGGRTIAEIAAAAGLSANTVYRRRLRGWPVEQLGTPLRSKKVRPPGLGGSVDLPERRRTVRGRAA